MILMQQSLINENDQIVKKIEYLVGSADILSKMKSVAAKSPFDNEIIDFLNSLSKKLLKLPEVKQYPDVVTLAFWMRKSSVMQLRERFMKPTTQGIVLGRGIAFHIAPSNVPVNYAYSLVTGLLTGNANIVRIPSKEFPQVTIINRTIKTVIEEYPNVSRYICLVRYERDQGINDLLSGIADIRIIWGGDNTIKEIRKSPLGARANDVTFADRYSLAVIDGERYLEVKDKERLAEEFYNDTFLSDQNACTSPRMVVWLGNAKEEAKELFWKYEHEIVKKKYKFQPIMAINKLSSSYMTAVSFPGSKIREREDNYIIRVEVPKAELGLMQLKDNAGFFFEYDCDDIMEIRDLCDDTHCQTIGFLGDKKQILPLVLSGVKGVDRIVPIGKTMDFDLIWDGYNLVERMTRTIKINI